MLASGPACPAHPEAPAAWRCAGCARDLCEACAATTPAGRGELPICATCGAMIELLTGPRAQVQPYAGAWLPALRPLFTLRALALVTLFTCTIEFLLHAGPNSWLLGQALESGWILIIVRLGGHGRPPFGVPDWYELESVFTGAWPRLLASAGIFAFGGAALVWLGLGQASPRDPALWLLAAATVALFPPALLFANVEGHGARWLWPWQLPEAARPFARDLVPARSLTALWAGLLVVKAQQPPLELYDLQMSDKILTGAALHFFALASLCAVACVTARLLFTRAEELEHGEPDGWRVPLRPDAVPSGRWSPAPVEKLDVEVAPIELEDGRAALLVALARGDLEQVTERWMRGEVRADALDDEAHVRIAQAFAMRGSEEFAANHLRALLHRVPGTRVAARAMVILARLCAERLGHPAEALALYRSVVERFPGTEAARFAQERLAAP
jgi:hypothetical protein